MAVTKILPRSGGLQQAIDYVLNGDKTDDCILTAHFNCDPGREYQNCLDYTKMNEEMQAHKEEILKGYEELSTSIRDCFNQ